MDAQLRLVVHFIICTVLLIPCSCQVHVPVPGFLQHQHQLTFQSPPARCLLTPLIMHPLHSLTPQHGSAELGKGFTDNWKYLLIVLVLQRCSLYSIANLFMVLFLSLRFHFITVIFSRLLNAQHNHRMSYPMQADNYRLGHSCAR